MKRIYESISDCFAFIGRSELLPKYDLTSNHTWICSNCSNYNFHYFIGGKINIYLSICKLCGVKQRDSIHMTLKNDDTYITVHDEELNLLETSADEKYVEIYSLIQKVITTSDSIGQAINTV